MSDQPNRKKWLAHVAAAAIAFGLVGFGPDVVELATHTTDTVEAQYAQARRVARRTSRRYDYYNYRFTLPEDATVVTREGDTSYEADGTYYRPVQADGQVIFEVVGEADIEE